MAFPPNPSINDTYVIGNKSYQWNGNVWARTSLTDVNNILSLYALDTDLNTNNVIESANLYYTNARVYANVIGLGYATNTYVNNRLLTKANVADLKTANVAEVTNLYFTNTRAVSALTAGAGISIASNGRITGSISSSISWQAVQTSNFSAVVGSAYPIDTSSGFITVTLPASATTGNEIILTDYYGTWGTNNVLVNPNGLKINGSTSNQTLATNYSSVNLVYINATIGWIVYSGMTGSAFVPAGPPSTVEYLVVAGGGGGGDGAGGGGGAGGLRSNTSFAVTAGTPYTVTVGAGGAANVIGSNSVFSTITSTGGGFGGYGGVASTAAGTGGSGGSGGGGGWANAPGGVSPGGSGNTPSTTPSQGNNGGSGQHTPGISASAGGGGGAGVAGTSAAGYDSGAGGNGANSTITGPSVSYAGGGAGGRGNASPGGFGGGGSNLGPAAPSAGTTNTGGGGGGGTLGQPSAGGGSGIVIIAYQDVKSNIASIGVGLTYTVDLTTRVGYKVYKFTAGTGTISW